MKRMFKVIMVGLAIFIVAACGTTGNSTSGSKSRKADSNGMYRVKSGDTLGHIARANGVSYTDIMRWNGLTDPDLIEVGWRLRVKPNASGSSSATVRSSNNSGSAQSSNNGVSVAKVKIPSGADRDTAANPDIENNITWQWPVAGALLTRFDGSASKGVVLAGNLGDPVVSAADGEVIYAGNGLRGYGNMVVVNHSDSWSSVYANNSSLLVQKGARVKAGQTIARMGSSDVKRVQLYFEVRLNAKPIDPRKVLPDR